MSKPIIGISANQRLNIALDNLPWSYAPTGLSRQLLMQVAYRFYYQLVMNQLLRCMCPWSIK